MKSKIVGITFIALLFFATQVQAILIDFESDTPGPKPNGFTSNDSPLVHFYDSYSSDLVIYDYGVQSKGQALAVYDDSDNSHLIMQFDTLLSFISFEFGNDDPRWTNEGDQAILTLFNGPTQVGQVAVVMNRNDIMDQNISFVAALFDNTTFKYHATGFTGGLTEVVDNINLNPIPEPTTILLLGSGLLGLAGYVRRKFFKK